MERNFNLERVLIGQGKRAKVYLWNGFAYKCFDDDYPEDWIRYEMSIQKLINETELKTVKYYESEFPHSIKMDYIEGISLANRVFNEKYKESIDDLFSLFDGVHNIKGLALPDLNAYLLETIDKTDIEDNVKVKAIKCIDELPSGDTLCHLDS